MSKRNIFIILLFIIATILLFFTNNKEKEKNSLHNFIFKDLSIDKVEEIYLKNFTIKKDKDGIWKIDNVKCNKYRIEYLVNYLKEIDFSNVISNKKENYEKFKVDDKGAIKLFIKTKDKIYKLYIGKFTPDGNGCYVRLDNGNVYLITKNLTFEVDKDKKYYYLEQKKKKSE